MKALSLLIPLAVLVACNGTPTAVPTPTVIPVVTPEDDRRISAMETKLARLEWQVTTLLVILQEFEEVGK